MAALQAGDLAKWTGGAWRPREPAGIRGVSTDTRSLRSGNLYIALRGANHDGHEFVAQAFEKGAAAAVVQDDYTPPAALPGSLLAVPDTLKALTAIAAGYRQGLRGEFIAVTGSTGKTTVKEMIADVLRAAGRTARTRGNWNNDIGLPLSLLAMNPGDRFGVFELGMNHPGELDPLCRLLRPSWGVITNVGPVHLEFFDSVRSIALEKAAVLRSLPPDGTAVIGADGEWARLLAESAPCRVITTSVKGRADYEGRSTDARAGRFEVLERSSGERAAFEVPLPGEYVVSNALPAIAVGRAHGLSWDALAAALKKYAPLPLRWNRLNKAGIEIVNDAYNANPMSMRAAFEAFAGVEVRGGRWLVLGGMRELGAAEKDEHAKLGRDIAAGPWKGLITVGKLGSLIAAAAAEAGMAPVVSCPDHAAAALEVRERVRPGDAMLLKASRGEQVERVLDELEKLGN